MSDADLRIATASRAARVRSRFDGRASRRRTKARAWPRRCGRPACAAGASDASEGPPSRTLFCAMGVCQQCAVWIDGARVESCRVAVRDGLDVRTRTSSARMPTSRDVRPPTATSRTASTSSCSVQVPRRTPPRHRSAAATACAWRSSTKRRAGRPGLSRRAGHRPTRPTAIAPTATRCDASSRRADVDALLRHACLAASSASDERWHVHALGPRGPLTLRARALIVATGAHRAALPVRRMGSSRRDRARRGDRAAEGAAHAAGARGRRRRHRSVAASSSRRRSSKAGGRVVAVVDAQPRSAWFAQAAALASRPDLWRAVSRGARAARASACRYCTRRMLRAIDRRAAVRCGDSRRRRPRGHAARDARRARRVRRRVRAASA